MHLAAVPLCRSPGGAPGRRRLGAYHRGVPHARLPVEVVVAAAPAGHAPRGSYLTPVATPIQNSRRRAIKRAATTDVPA